MNNIKYAKTKEIIKDDKPIPIVQVAYLERIGDVAVIEPYGIHGSAPKETICLMLTINNDESNRVIIPLSALTRTRNLNEGEFECGNFKVGSIIKFDKNGNINIKSDNDINIEAGSGDINVIGDIHVIGGIDVSNDVVAGTVSLKNHIQSGVTSGAENSGPPVP